MYSITDHYLSNYSIKFSPFERCTNCFQRLAPAVYLSKVARILIAHYGRLQRKNKEKSLH